MDGTIVDRTHLRPASPESAVRAGNCDRDDRTLSGRVLFALRQLGREGLAHRDEIAAYLGTNAQSVSDVVETLFEQGLVCRDVTSDHVALTPLGRAA